VFQTTAWAQMIRDYSKTGTIAEAIAKTYNGRSPCGMCTKISEERQKENSPAAVKFDKKGEIFFVAVRRYLQRPGIKDYRYFDLDDPTSTKRSQTPPAPVPRLSKCREISEHPSPLAGTSAQEQKGSPKIEMLSAFR
jgi:hypothetical protein